MRTVDADTVAGSTASEKVAVGATVRAAPVLASTGLTEATVGPVVSTVQVRPAAVGSVPPALVERTAKVWAPSASPVTLNGDAQAFQAPLSIVQARVAVGSAGDTAKENDAEVTRTVPFGPLAALIVVSGVGAAGAPLK